MISLKYWKTGMMLFNPMVNATDIAVLYIESPKIKKIKNPCLFPLTISRTAMIKAHKKIRGKMIIAIAWALFELLAKLAFLA